MVSLFFWLDICRENLNNENIIVQDNMNTLSQLVDVSSLPVFNSNRVIKLQDESMTHITIPVVDKQAYVVHYLVCLKSEKHKFLDIFKMLTY